MGATDFDPYATLHELRVLTRFATDAGDGFAIAASIVRDDDLADLCHTAAANRVAHRSALEQLIDEMGGDPPERGTRRGRAHRTWLSAARLRGDRAVLRECLRGERASLQRYDRLLRSILPRTIRSALEGQQSAVRYELERMAMLLGRTSLPHG